MNKRILGLALPNIVTNITVPLLGMVDMAIVGHLSGDHIGAIAIGTQIFNLIYWNFGFLRMGTSGFTAQAFGAERWDEAVKILIRACAIALSIALLLVALQWPISLAVPLIFEGSNHVLSLALTYFFVRIWAAPATLGLYAIKGWFIGMQDSKTPMWIAIALNCVNIVLSLLFVIVLKWDIFGVALGTVLANYSGLAMGILFLRRKFRRFNHLSMLNVNRSTIKDALHWADMRRFFKVNGDIFLRTLCLSGVFTFITAASSHISDQILAVDACCCSSSPSSAISWTVLPMPARASWAVISVPSSSATLSWLYACSSCGAWHLRWSSLASMPPSVTSSYTFSPTSRMSLPPQANI